MKQDFFTRLEAIVRGDVGYSYYLTYTLDIQDVTKPIIRRSDELFELDAQTSATPVATVGGDMLGLAMVCFILNFQHEGQELLSRSEKWLLAALSLISHGQTFLLPYQPHFYLVLHSWLSGPPTTPYKSKIGCQLCKESLQLLPNRELDFSWGCTFPPLINAGEAEYCVRTFERLNPSYPPARRRNHTSAQLAYLIARDRLKRPAISDEQLQSAVNEFMNRQVSEWLNRGHYHDFTEWVRLLSRAKSGDPARRSLREIALQYA